MFNRCLSGHQETKQLAEATFLKKQMYYNMRIKTMHRNARNVIRIASEGKKVWLEEILMLCCCDMLWNVVLCRAVRIASKGKRCGGVGC